MTWCPLKSAEPSFVKAAVPSELSVETYMMYSLGGEWCKLHYGDQASYETLLETHLKLNAQKFEGILFDTGNRRWRRSEQLAHEDQGNIL